MLSRERDHRWVGSQPARAVNRQLRPPALSRWPPDRAIRSTAGRHLPRRSSGAGDLHTGRGIDHCHGDGPAARRGCLKLSATLAMWLSVLSIVAAANAQAGPITDERDVPWVSLRDLTNARYVEAFERYRSGYRLIDVDAYPDNGELRYSMIWQRNTDGRRWASRRGMTSSEYHQWWERYRDEGLRPHDVEGYRTSSGLRFAGIWVENSEGVGWSSRRNLTSDEYGDYVREQRAAGRRPVDLELYETGAGRRIAAIFYDNPTGTAWAALRGMPRQRDLGHRHQGRERPLSARLRLGGRRREEGRPQRHGLQRRIRLQGDRRNPGRQTRGRATHSGWHRCRPGPGAQDR
jgi:hypothetical protein